MREHSDYTMAEIEDFLAGDTHGEESLIPIKPYSSSCCCKQANSKLIHWASFREQLIFYKQIYITNNYYIQSLHFCKVGISLIVLNSWKY